MVLGQVLGVAKAPSFGWVILIVVVLSALLAAYQGDGPSSVTDETGGAFGGFVFFCCIFGIIGTIVYLAIWQ
jgi:hypothetical protein